MNKEVDDIFRRVEDAQRLGGKAFSREIEVELDHTTDNDYRTT